MSLSFDAFGPLAYPLLLCSFMSLMLLVERLIFFVYYQSDGNVQQVLNQIRSKDNSANHSIVYPKNRLVRGAILLLDNAQESRLLREEIINHWLASEREQLFQHFAWFVLLAVIAPMLGLLGTVLGIIKVFSAIANHTGPVHPALLAEGLGQAMLTTAAGLVVALPVLVALHSLRIWANSRLTQLAQNLNAVNLSLEGIDLISSVATAATSENKTTQIKLA